MHFPGEELRARRIDAGLSRFDVYKKLHIPVRFTQAIEESALDTLPPLIYSVGFFRTYCHFLHLDPEPYLAALQAAARPPRSFLRIRNTSAGPDRPVWFSELVMWAAIIGIVILGWFAYAAVFRLGPDTESGTVRADALDLRLPDARGPD